MQNSIVDKERGIINRLRELHPEIPMMKLKKSFHKFGKKTDAETLKKVVDDAKSSDNLGLLIN